MLKSSQQTEELNKSNIISFTPQHMVSQGRGQSTLFKSYGKKEKVICLALCLDRLVLLQMIRKALDLFGIIYLGGHTDRSGFKATRPPLKAIELIITKFGF